MAAEPLAAEAGVAGGGTGAAAGGLAAMPGGGSHDGGGERNHGTLLALGIVLLWLAGVAFFFAFEGIQAEQAGTTGGGLLKGLISGLAAKAQAQEQSNSGEGG